MTTRQSMDQLLEHCEGSLQYARNQLSEGKKQEHYNDTEFTKAQQQLENAYKELEEFSHSANAQQREQLYRMRLQIQNMQNEMVLTDH
jgi:polyhydroxyalkanoate synthesis regulator phasin